MLEMLSDSRRQERKKLGRRLLEKARENVLGIAVMTTAAAAALLAGLTETGRSGVGHAYNVIKATAEDHMRIPEHQEQILMWVNELPALQREFIHIGEREQGIEQLEHAIGQPGCSTEERQELIDALLRMEKKLLGVLVNYHMVMENRGQEYDEEKFERIRDLFGQVRASLNRLQTVRNPGELMAGTESIQQR
jgi:hypothetical protein